MSQAASIEWWNKSLDEVGVHCMDRMIPADAKWSTVLKSGCEDLTRAIEITGMTCGRDRIVVEVGCGVGRMSAALADRFGRVVGLDIAPRLIEEARQRNDNVRVSFELSNGVHIAPESIADCDAIFSYEVFYYLNPDALAVYFQDAYSLLRAGGEFVFHLNMEPVRLTTRLSFWFRQQLYRCGIKHWRGWPTGAGLRRYCHTADWLRKTLTRIGFQVERIKGPNLRQMWVVALKPEE